LVRSTENGDKTSKSSGGNGSKSHTAMDTKVGNTATAASSASSSSSSSSTSASASASSSNLKLPDEATLTRLFLDGLQVIADATGVPTPLIAIQLARMKIFTAQYYTGSGDGDNDRSSSKKGKDTSGGNKSGNAPKNAGDPWTDEDRKQVRDIWKAYIKDDEGIPEYAKLKSVGDRMGRSPYSIACVLEQHGYPKPKENMDKKRKSFSSSSSSSSWKKKNNNKSDSDNDAS
jgi:hypothetical protein